MGLVKINIMYWGFYEYYYIHEAYISVHKYNKSTRHFLCIFYKKPSKFTSPEGTAY